MDKQTNEESGETLNVEEIMAAIRQKIGADVEPSISDQEGVASGPLSAALYQHLNEARISYDRIQPVPHVVPSYLPFVGKAITSLKLKLHELILFYVNQLAANQIRVNGHLLQIVEILIEETEKDLE